ncbi:MAG: 23S rRNA (adenine(2030)-N(6))-methyltransferase RlmJ [Treponemataceae bacterium]|nr:23S rRNA (adenine(2030)-N(6))-methyltransferase RlmJ [Treponemataceae bacterium]
MLSYEHIYHAGNHADILKHTTLTLILGRLLKKETPITVYDTHAGFGCYDLTDTRAQKTNEAESGIRRLLRAFADEAPGTTEHTPPQSAEAAALLAPYLALCRTYATQDRYPGSPEIARAMLRGNDRLLLSERHPQAVAVLRGTMRTSPLTATQTAVKPHVHFRDGYEMLRALTPPATGRGVALIDPSFEDTSDFSACADTICAVHKRWPNGIIALWYPLLEHRATETAHMKQQIVSCATATQAEPIVLDIQLAVQSPAEKTGLAKLYGSGMLVVRFPYQLDDQMRTILPALAAALGNEHARWSVETCG